MILVINFLYLILHLIYKLKIAYEQKIHLLIQNHNLITKFSQKTVEI